MTKKKKIILIISAIVLALIGVLLVCIFGFRHRHQMMLVDAVEETCLKDGLGEHYVCEKCGKIFLDKEGTMEVTEEDVLITAPGHEAEEHEAVNPTFTKEGMKQYWKCSRCGKYFIDAACTVEVKKIDLILPVLDGDGFVADGSISGELATSLLRTGTLSLRESIEGATNVMVVGNANFTKVYRDSAEISFTVASADETIYQVKSVIYNGKALTPEDGVYKITYSADATTIDIEIERDQSDKAVTLPSIPAK